MNRVSQEEQVKYQLSPREIAPPKVKKPTKKELFPQLTDYAKRAITILDDEVFDKLWRIHDALLEARRKVSELEKQYDLARQEASKIPGVVNSVRQVYEWLAKRTEDINSVYNVAYQYKGRLGDFLVSLSREVLKEEPPTKMLDPHKTADFVQKAKELGLITDEVVDIVMSEIEKTNKVIEEGRKVVGEIRTMYIWKPREVDTQHLAKQADEGGFWAKLKEKLIGFVRSVADWLGFVQQNDSKIQELVNKAQSLIVEPEPVVGSIVYVRGALAKVVGKKEDKIAVKYLHADLSELVRKSSVMSVSYVPVIRMEKDRVRIADEVIEDSDAFALVEKAAYALSKYGFNDEEIMDILDTVAADFGQHGYSERVCYRVADSKVIMVGDTDYVEIDDTGMVTVWDKATGKKKDERKVESKEQGIVDYGKQGYSPV